ncbi:MAG: signal transduction histidine kinase [Nitriliruptoraceae bacterium]|jgi:signal transduction histidine kinase
MTGLLTTIGLLGLAGLLAAELLLRPSPMDRIGLTALLGGVTVLSMLLATALQRFTRRSLALGVLATSMVAVVVTGLAVSAAAGAMFVSSHDLRLVLVVLGLGVGAGLALALGLVRPLVGDLDRIGQTARAVAAGDRSVRTGVHRPDELGSTASALDGLIDRLAAAESDRARLETARSRFLAAIGHDLRSPLTVLRSGLEAVEDGIIDDVDELVGTLLREVDLLGSLVEDLFLLARIESHGLQLRHDRLDLAELADEAAEAVTHLARRRGVTIVVSAPHGIPVDGDARELGRVLRNLLDNAVRHTPDDSTVRVVLDDVSRAGNVTVTVLDEGPGFPADRLEVLFSSFVRGTQARARDGGGAGLGLAIARGLVEAHGGRISAAPGPGGRIDVQLPVAV